MIIKGCSRRGISARRAPKVIEFDGVMDGSEGFVSTV
jgi:hypothetical protein